MGILGVYCSNLPVVAKFFVFSLAAGKFLWCHWMILPSLGQILPLLRGDFFFFSLDGKWCMLLFLIEES